MTADTNARRESHTPLADDHTAHLVAALPQEYSHTHITHLFSRGYDRWVTDGNAHTDELVSHIERFGTSAFSDTVRTRTLDDPIVDDPGALAVLATLSALCVKTHSKFEHAPPSKIQLLRDLSECYLNTMLGLIRVYDGYDGHENDHGNRSDRRGNETEGEVTEGGFALHQALAEILYAKPEGEIGPHPGRVCTGVEQMTELGDGYYVEIPIVAASEACLVRATNTYDEQGKTADDQLRTRIAANHLYVPLTALERMYREMGSTVFGTLLSVQRDTLSEEQLRWLGEQDEAITARIDRFVRANQHTRLWTDWDDGERLIRALITAIDAASDEHARVGEFHHLTDLYNAIQAYEPSRDSTQRILARIVSPASLAKALTSHLDHPNVAVRTEQDGPPLFQLTDTRSGSRPLTVEQIEDLFELPCMANMDERLAENGPVRKDLYNFVRTVMWLPQYQDAAFETILTDLKEVFSRWPWYDEQTTEYQVRYEFENDIGGAIPLPMNCDNEDIQRYCIGQDVCPYSIWGSISFPDKMYQQVDENDDFGKSLDHFER